MPGDHRNIAALALSVSRDDATIDRESAPPADVKFLAATSLLAITLIISLDPASAADIRRWRDAQGHLHFGDNPPSAAHAEKLQVKPNVYSAPSVEALQIDFDRPSEIVMYGTSWCGVCKRARSYFSAHHIHYREYDVETTEKGQRDYARLGSGGVPIILVNGQRLNGFDAAIFENMYSRRGSRLPATRRPVTAAWNAQPSSAETP